jgi:hypothetical protein
MTPKAFEKPTHCLICATKIDLQEGIELVSGGQIGIEHKCTLKCGFCQRRDNGTAVREFPVILGARQKCLSNDCLE